MKEKLIIDKNTDVNEIIEELKEGVKNLMTSERYKQFLDFRSSLYQYSFNNCILISMQKPDATLIGSYNFWKKNNRFVNKGEKGIKILAPVTSKKIIELPELDKDKKPILDADGKEITKKVEKTVIVGFTLATVFDVSQTSGEPIPDILKELSGNSSKSEKLIETIKSISEIPISYEKISGGTNGYYSPKERKIVIREGMSLDQTAKTLIHEYTHSKLHNDIIEYVSNRGESEIQAESTAYVVSKHFGIDTSDFSFGYITGWAKGKDLDQLQDTLKIISDTAKKVISEIEEKLYEEYKVESDKTKETIKAMINKEGFKATETVVNNIFSLNKIHGREFTMKEISDYYKYLDGFTGSELEKDYISKIGDELKSQEISNEKIVKLAKDNELSI